MLFDAHNHLQLLAGQAPSAVERARAAGVSGMAVNATSPDDWRPVVELAASCPCVVPCIGLHPWKAGKAAPGWKEELSALLEKSPGLRIGETGLDMVKNENFEAQKAALSFQLGLAARLRRPIVLHCVQAWGPLKDMLEKNPLPSGFMLHSYGGSADIVPALAKMGGYFSFTGEIGDGKRLKLRKALAAVPTDRLLFETESPALKGDNPPLWRREPSGLPDVVKMAAEVLGQPYERLAARSQENAERFFGAGK